MENKRKIRSKFCPGDGIIILTIVILAFFFAVSLGKSNKSNKGTIAAVYQNGKKVQEFLLSEDREITLDYKYENKLMIKDGKAAIVDSNCPGKDCVHSGWIHGIGRSLICLPNHLEIRIEGDTASEVDFIVR